jgi:hypothetical protein
MLALWFRSSAIVSMLPTPWALFRRCPSGSVSMETSGSLKFPSYPLVCVPCSNDPGGVHFARHGAPWTAAFRCVHTSAFPPMFWKLSYCPQLYIFRDSITRPATCSARLRTFPYGNARGLRYRPAGWALVGWDLSKRRSHPLDNNDKFHRISPIPNVSGLP